MRGCPLLLSRSIGFLSDSRQGGAGSDRKRIEPSHRNSVLGRSVSRPAKPSSRNKVLYYSTRVTAHVESAYAVCRCVDRSPRAATDM